MAGDTAVVTLKDTTEVMPGFPRRRPNSRNPYALVGAGRVCGGADSAGLRQCAGRTLASSNGISIPFLTNHGCAPGQPSTLEIDARCSPRIMIMAAPAYPSLSIQARA